MPAATVALDQGAEPERAPTGAPGMAIWRKRLFVAIARSAASPVECFRRPHDRTVTTSGRIAL